MPANADSAAMQGVVYELGPFRLHPDAGALTQAGLPTPLGARAVAVLAALLRTPNEYVSKAKLLDAVWPDVVVEENSLAVQISAIRRVLARVPGGEDWIETLSRRGYRFVGPVTELLGNAPSSAASDRQRSNLPASSASFIGRERELVEIKRLLPKSRLLTVVGVGGIGKTRFALQAANELTVAYRDGVWLVDLASLSDPSLVPSAVAQALGVREIQERPILETLCLQFAGRQLLLLLDNCEHLLEACALMVDALLQRAADLTVLATSCEPLSLAGEQVYSLPTLSLPGPNSNIEDVARSEAVQLFVERAQKQLPDFALTNDRAPVVAQICVRLDGIPLALELAAARVRSLSVEQINARLDDRFNLLTGGRRTALPRQQTLRATFDWSYDLLAESERTVLRRLGVFAGGFTLEAAAQQASDSTIDTSQVTNILAQLVARSLVIADTHDVGARYRLLETTRAYALEKLAEAGETDAARRRHAQYFCHRFERAPRDWLRISDQDLRKDYLLELDNVRAALDWAFGSDGSTAIGVALAATSAQIWVELSLPGEGRQRLEAAVARVGSETPDLSHAQLWHGLGVLCGTGALPQELAAIERAVDLFRRAGDSPGLAHSLVRRGLAFTVMGRIEHAAQTFAEAAPLVESTDLPRLRAFYLSEIGLLQMVTGNAAKARKHFEEAMSLYRAIGAERDALDQLGNLADLTWTLGDLDAALAGFREAVEVLRRLPMAKKSQLGGHLINLSGVYTERGDLDAALAAAREGLPLFNVAGGVVWYLLDHMALRAALAGLVANAARMAGFADAAYVAKGASRQPNEARARSRLGTLLRERLPSSELERLLAEGANMSEDDAQRLALKED